MLHLAPKWCPVTPNIIPIGSDLEFCDTDRPDSFSVFFWCAAELFAGWVEGLKLRERHPSLLSMRVRNDIGDDIGDLILD